MNRIIDSITGRKRNDLVGERFGRWTVLECTGRNGPQTTWRCQCDCGTVKSHVLYSALTGGTSNSCGCLRTELLRSAAKHGRSKTRIYTVWQQAKDRVFNKSRRSWKHYGGRGIGMHGPWVNDFVAFAAYVLENLGEPPYGAKLDRIDNDGNYEPGNIRWADDFTSAKNTRKTRWHWWKGELRTLTEIACMENVCYLTFRNRMVWPTSKIEVALAICRKRGLVYKERAKGNRPPILVPPDLEGTNEQIMAQLEGRLGQSPVQ